MHFSTDPTSGPTDKIQIRSCEPGVIHLRDESIRTHVIIAADRIITDWNPPAFETLSLNDFAPALELKPDVILFGTGARQRFPDIALLTDIMRSGVAIEVMETVAACRTFNVLINERRAAVAALLVE